MKPEKFSVGYVLWADANMDTSNQLAHTVRHKPVHLLSAGVIVQNDGAGVTLAQDFGEDGSFRDTKFIPRENIRRVEVLKKEAVARSPQWVVLPGPKRTKRRGKRG